MRPLPVLVVCPFLQGCLAFGYPSVTQTPAVAVTEPDVKAFRVTRDHKFFGALIAGAFQIGDAVEEIPISENVIPSQSNSYFHYRTLAFPFAGHHERSVSVCLYRRGFEPEIVQARFSFVECWRQEPIKVTWKKIETSEAREKAVDDLNSLVVNRSNAISVFIAEEYLALAGSTTDEETRRRLQDKSQKILAGLYWHVTATNR